MTLQDIFDSLSAGELSQVDLGIKDNGKVAEADWGRLLTHVNLGLTALYKRFTLKSGQVTLALQPNQVTYNLNPKYAASNFESAVATKYLLDSVLFPFKGDVLKVARVLTDRGLDLSLNDHNDGYAVATPSQTVLQVPALMVNGSVDCPDELKTATLDIRYRASHPMLVKEATGFDDFDPATLELELPGTHLQALLYFVASRVHNPIGMVNEFNAGNNWAAKYEQECQRLELENMQVDQGAQSARLARGGWV